MIFRLYLTTVEPDCIGLTVSQSITASMDRTVAVWSPSGAYGVWDVSMRAGEVGGNTLGLFGARCENGGTWLSGCPPSVGECGWQVAG